MKRFLLVAAALPLLSACEASKTTSTDQVFTVKANMADSTVMTVGTPVIVSATITHGADPIVGVAVMWTVAEGGGFLSSPQTGTDTLGVAKVRWTIGTTPGVNSLAISSGDGVDTLRIIGVVDAATELRPVSDERTTVALGGTATIQVKVVDRFGNGVPSATVTWATTGGALSSASTTTNASGVAQTTVTAPASAGTFSVTATLPGLATQTFDVVAQ
jgi:adhesin/invasin